MSIFHIPFLIYRTWKDWHKKIILEIGGEKSFLDGLKRDECKNKWCVENNVKLIRIKYDQISKISEILNNELQIVNKK